MSLQRATPPAPAGTFLHRHLGGLVAVVAGAISLIAAFFMQFGGEREVTELPNPLVTVPLLVVAGAGAGWSLLKREPHRYLGIAGVGGAVAAAVLGWLVVAAAVAAVAAIICLILAKFM